jgi:hypothetical protein
MSAEEPSVDAGDVTLGEWASRREPNLFVTSKSEPEPVLLTYNLVAVLDDPADSRELLLKWERIRTAAAGVGFVALSSDKHPDGPDPYQAPSGQGAVATTDSQKVSGHAIRKVLRGAIPGCLLGAVVVALVAVVLEASAGRVIGAAVGGAFFGFIAGAVASFVAGTGWSEAYKESFVDPEATEVVFASIHSDQIDTIKEAANVAALADERLLSIDRNGRPAPLDGADRASESS